MAERILKALTSLKLTVALLALSVVLVFIGTLAQVSEGLYAAQTRYFKSWLIFRPMGWPILFPGGYLLGTALLVNLVAAHAARFRFTWKRAGLLLVHAGLVLLLLGQLLTDMLSVESILIFEEGEAKNYSQDFRKNELVFIDTTDPREDRVVAIPEEQLASQKEIRHAQLPVVVRVKQYWPNSSLLRSPAESAVLPVVTAGDAAGLHVQPQRPTVRENERNMPSAVLELLEPGGGSLGTWLVSTYLNDQTFVHQGRTNLLALRFTRYYKPFSLKLLEFTHQKYKGTEIPKHFASRVRLQRPDTGEDREVTIYMNNPLRYEGETFYQAGFDEDNDKRLHKISKLQVVRNPSWLAPYFACVIVALGLIWQFLSHLLGAPPKIKTP